jgi:hypothetical protein
MGEKLAKLAKMYSGEAFFGCDDPLEAVLFSVLLRCLKARKSGCHRKYLTINGRRMMY